MAVPYTASRNAPKTAWARYLDQVRRERGLSATGLFELVRDELGLSPKSRAAFLPFLEDKEPTAQQAAALRRALGGEPSFETPAVVATEPGRGVTDSAGLAAAIERQTNVLEKISAVLDGLVARVAELGTIQGAQTHALESMLTEFPTALAAGLALREARAGAGTRSPDEPVTVGVK